MQGWPVAVPIGEVLRPTPAGAAQAAICAMTVPSRMEHSVEVAVATRPAQGFEWAPSRARNALEAGAWPAVSVGVRMAQLFAGGPGLARSLIPVS